MSNNLKNKYTGINPKYRKKKGYKTQQQFLDASKLDVSKTTLSGYEQGSQIINAKSLIEISNFLNVTVEKLLDLNPATSLNTLDNKMKLFSIGNTNIKLIQENYFLDENLNSKNLHAFKLEQDNHLLQIPKGSTIIVEELIDKPSDRVTKTTPCIIRIKDKKTTKTYISKIGPTNKIDNISSDRVIDTYSHFHFINENGETIICNKSTIDEILFGVIKKVIIDFN